MIVKTVTYPIEYRVFKKEDVLRLSKEIFTIYNRSKSKHVALRFAICAEDNTEYEIHNSDFKSVENTLDIKKINNITMHYHDYDAGKDILINLVQGQNLYSNNNLKVEGSDSKWVDTNYQKFKEIFDSVKPQNNFFLKHNRLIFHFCSVNVGFMILKFIVWLYNYFNVETSSDYEPGLLLIMIENVPFFRYVLLVLMSWMFGAWMLYLFWDMLMKLWPSIEFDFGPEHLKIQKNRRNTIAAIISLIAIPLIIQLLFFLLS